MGKDSPIFEVSLSIHPPEPQRCELLRSLLLQNKIKEHQIIQSQDDQSLVLSVYLSAKEKAKDLSQKFRKYRLQGVDVRYQLLKSRDWQNQWKESFKPFVLTSGFSVVPFHYRDKYRSTKTKPIYIDTSYAFGTGLHPTTRYMAGFISRLKGKFDTFLDIGTGTGILSIVAVKCGAQKIQGLDLKRNIIDVAKMNFRANGIKPRGLRAVNFEKYIPQSFDLVAANLITQDLIVFKKKILSCVGRGKYLAVSGISLKQYPRLREAFQSLPLKCLKVERGEGWSAILYKRV